MTPEETAERAAALADTAAKMTAKGDPGAGRAAAAAQRLAKVEADNYARANAVIETEE